jgi:hypothetical protein
MNRLRPDAADSDRQAAKEANSDLHRASLAPCDRERQGCADRADRDAGKVFGSSCRSSFGHEAMRNRSSFRRSA